MRLVFDKRLLRLVVQVKQLAAVAASCVLDVAVLRPNMSVVVNALQPYSEMKVKWSTELRPLKFAFFSCRDCDAEILFCEQGGCCSNASLVSFIWSLTLATSYWNFLCSFAHFPSFGLSFSIQISLNKTGYFCCIQICEACRFRHQMQGKFQKIFLLHLCPI